MKNYRVGIIGCKNIFPMHAVSINTLENAQLVAVCDIEEERAKARAEENNCKYYLDYKEMIDREELDVVHICTPHYLHPPMAIYAAQKGVNVLTEKPMSIKLEDAEAMVQTAKDEGVSLGVIFQNHYNPGPILIKETLESGALGKIISGKALVTWDRPDEYYSQDYWRGTWDMEGGGVVINQAIHTLDMMRWFVDDEIQSVDAFIGNRAHAGIEVEDIAEGRIEYKNGVVTGFYVMNYYSYDAPVEIELHCENGIARIIGDNGIVELNNGRVYTADTVLGDAIEYGEAKSYWGTSHLKQIAQYYEALDKGEKPEIHGEYALKTQEMVCAIYDSGKEKLRAMGN